MQGDTMMEAPTVMQSCVPEEDKGEESLMMPARGIEPFRRRFTNWLMIHDIGRRLLRFKALVA